jgi:hypothetical protein
VLNDSRILTIALASVPATVAVLVGILVNNARLTDLRGHLDARFNAIDVRFVVMKDLWRSALHRVEEVLDARLKHLEER